MAKDHSDSKRGNPLPAHGLLLAISSKDSFICTIPQTGEHIPRHLLYPSWSTGWNDPMTYVTIYDLSPFQHKWPLGVCLDKDIF